MLKDYFPYEYADSVYDIDFRQLYADGFRGLLFDIDNTLVHHGEDADRESEELFRELHSIGFRTLLLTNNDEARVKRFVKNIDTLYLCEADKPSVSGYNKALDMLSVKKSEAVMIGDQIFTDILGANRCGIASVLVHYITVPGAKIGKKRYIEQMIIRFCTKSRRYSHRLGDIIKSSPREPAASGAGRAEQ